MRRYQMLKGLGISFLVCFFGYIILSLLLALVGELGFLMTIIFVVAFCTHVLWCKMDEIHCLLKHYYDYDASHTDEKTVN